MNKVHTPSYSEYNMKASHIHICIYTEIRHQNLFSCENKIRLGYNCVGKGEMYCLEMYRHLRVSSEPQL
jgi:hypothetical protein